MISYISGKVLSKGKNNLVVLTQGGVGYEVGMTNLQLAKYSEGKQVSLFLYLKVSDSALSLYGFETVEEKAFFQLLLSVSGVGPKSAMNILALGSIADIQSAIARGDVKYLTAVQGMGKKTAERMVVELRSKIQDSRFKIEDGQSNGILVDVIEGLVAMGYSKEEAKMAVKGIETEGKTVEVLLKKALKQLAVGN